MSEKANNRKNIVALELANYNAPKTESQMGSKYVYWGKRNSYFGYIEECYKGSTTNRAIISSISQLMYGKGLKATDSEERPLEWKRVKRMFKPKDLRLIMHDYKKYGKACFQVGYSTIGERRAIKTIHHPVETIAKGKKNRLGQTEMYYFSPDWSKPSVKITEIPAFGTSEESVELFYIDGFANSIQYYSDVDYQAGLQYAKVEEEVSNYHINNIQNGFTPSMMISFNNGIPETEELQYEIEQDVQNKFGGTSNAGKLVITFNQDAASAPTMTALQLNKAAEQYTFVSEEAQKKLFISHKVTSPLLLGIPTSTGLSNNADELKNSYMLFNTTVIEPLQEPVLEAIADVLAVNGWEFDLYMQTLMPASFVAEEVIDIIEEVDDDTADSIEKETGITKEEE